MLIAPSVLASDFTNLASEMERVKTADYIHLDIMDGHFVPNISFGPDVVSQLRKTTVVPFDVHLMISHPLKYIERFANAGADIICFHIECADDPGKVMDKIIELGKKPALTLKPGTPVEKLYPYLDRAFMVLVMTVEPGFGGQSFMVDQLEKVRELRKRYPQLLIEADGGINQDTILYCKSAGVDICVAGTAVFKAKDPAMEIQRLKSI